MYYGISYQKSMPWCVFFGRYRQKTGWEHQGRKLPFHLLVFMIDGKAVFTTSEHEIEVSDGDWILIPQDTHYAAKTDSSCEYYFFHFKGELAESDVIPDAACCDWGFGYSKEPREDETKEAASCFLSPYMSFPEYKHLLSPYCSRLHHYLYVTEPEAEYEFQLVFLQLLLELSRLLRGEVSSTMNVVVNKIVYYIHENLSVPMTTDSLAEHFGISKSYLMKLFKQTFNTSVLGYINRVKMEYAAQLLRTSVMNISEVAEFLGYEDQAYFSRIFKKYFGQSPSKFI